jgi:alpha,alpha-trehalase
LNNNAYTNVMAAWALQTALKVLNLLAEDKRNELLRWLGIKDEEIADWRNISERMFVPFHGDGIISQFEGYENLEEFDWQDYKKKYGDIQRLDRIIESEGDSVNRYKASKQADVLMLFYLFSAEQIIDLFEIMGYDFKPGYIPRNIEYYSRRTSHGSTLSRVVHSWVMARSQREKAWHLFKNALKSDVSDIQGGTTSEGIHLGAMAGSVDLIQRCFTGLEMREDVLWLNPRLPGELKQIEMRIYYRGHRLRVCVFRDKLEVSLVHGPSAPIKIGINNKVSTISQGDFKEFYYRGDAF